MDTLRFLSLTEWSITNIAGIEGFIVLEMLSISYSDIKNVDLFNNKKMKKLYAEMTGSMEDLI